MPLNKKCRGFELSTKKSLLAILTLFLPVLRERPCRIPQRLLHLPLVRLKYSARHQNVRALRILRTKSNYNFPHHTLLRRSSNYTVALSSALSLSVSLPSQLFLFFSASWSKVVYSRVSVGGVSPIFYVCRPHVTSLSHTHRSSQAISPPTRFVVHTVSAPTNRIVAWRHHMLPP